MGISKLLRVATSYWPAWLENSWLILSRTSFSGSTVKFTLMPVSLVKFAAVSCCRSTICGLFTISTLMLLAPPPPPPAPQPAQPPSRASTSGTASTRPRLGLRPATGHLQASGPAPGPRGQDQGAPAHVSSGPLTCQIVRGQGDRQWFLSQWAPDRSDERRCPWRPR